MEQKMYLNLIPNTLSEHHFKTADIDQTFFFCLEIKVFYVYEVFSEPSIKTVAPALNNFEKSIQLIKECESTEGCLSIDMTYLLEFQALCFLFQNLSQPHL